MESSLPEAVLERLIRIEIKIDQVNDTASDHESRIRRLEDSDVPGGHQDHETRIRRVERSLWLAAGAAAAGGGMVGSLVAPFLQR